MNWDIVEGKWKQLKDLMRTQRGKPADHHPDMIAGKHVEVAGKMQETSPKGDYMKEEEILPRRDVLRGVLAVGCTVLMPTVFSGCDSQKGASPTTPAPAPAAPPATSTDSAAPAATTKVSQASVQYQTSPKGEQQCSTCMNFIPPNACKRVEGQISPDGWCLLWAKKT